MGNSVDKNRIRFFQKKILTWFEENGRSFPWREKGITSYQLIIAEVLLQRTRAETVSSKYHDFLDKYSSWQEIHETSISDLEEALKPFGLFRQKAKRLKGLAKELVENIDELPVVREELEEIPLVGQYIASAIISYVHEEKAPLLDVNMARVLERFFGPRELADIRYDPYLQELSKRVVDHPEHQMINWGILDFGSKLCKKRNPDCANCMLSNRCNYYAMKF